LLLTETGSRNGKDPSICSAHVFQLSDGKVTECWSESPDLYDQDEFWRPK
jgi:hypothetical protein